MSSSSGKNLEYEAATERVMQYLDSEFFSGKRPPGARLTPVRVLANELEVSSAVVHAVYRHLQAEGKIVSAVGRGTFLSPQFEAKKTSSSRRICLAISSPGRAPLHSEWSNAIVSAILKASTTEGRRVAILPFTAEAHSPEDVFQLLVDEVGEVDGLISFPIADRDWSQRILEVYGNAGKPVVQINASSSIDTENFVSANYYGSGVAIGRALLKAGRERLIFLAGAGFSRAVSSIQRVSGLCTALADYPDVDPLKVVHAGQISEEAGYNAIKRLLHGGMRPDAIYTGGDFLAIGAVEALREYGLDVPGDVSVIGGTGLKSSFDVISTIINPYEEIGEAAITMTLASISNQGKPVPGIYLPMRFAPGGTTHHVEDELLGADPLS